MELKKVLRLGFAWLAFSRLLGDSLHFRRVLVEQGDSARTRKEGVRDLDFESLRVDRRLRLLDSCQHLGTLGVLCLIVMGVYFGFGLFAILFCELVPGLFKLLILEAQRLGKYERLFGTAVSSKSVLDLWKLGLSNDRVLDFTCTITVVSQNYVALVYSQLER